MVSISRCVAKGCSGFRVRIASYTSIPMLSVAFSFLNRSHLHPLG